MRMMLKSKIHQARITEVNVSYEGTIAIDPVLMEAADILPYEMVQVLTSTMGHGLKPTLLKGKRDPEPSLSMEQRRGW